MKLHVCCVGLKNENSNYILTDLKEVVVSKNRGFQWQIAIIVEIMQHKSDFRSSSTYLTTYEYKQSMNFIFFI